ncbi:CRISPR-associated endonuclease Cas2 [Sorangium sp. So ce204]|uniref:CRISPR-associated endonuclease Cas2 n=1 Tax=Sorangium sp. So ce204 TaxID=3133288 RepID=UPI003F630E00
MTVLLVSYDVREPGDSNKRDKLLETIKSYNERHVQVSESSYAIYTNESPRDVHGRLAMFIDRSRDTLAVIRLDKPYEMSSHSEELLRWMTHYLGHLS